MADKKIIKTDMAPEAIGPYSQAVQSGNMLFVSGQLGINPGMGKLVSGGIEAETRQALDNLQHIVKKAGLGIESIVKTTVFLADIREFKAMNEIYSGYFKDAYPARAAFQVAALPLGARVEIEAIAVLQE
ncbi:MAG: RidA family protein [Spirochaetales bacterium]|nr:RidA family protein [Spirochaetales bacterium]